MVDFVLKLTDIKRFTDDGGYHIHVNLQYLKSTLDSYANNEGLELNPDFQRGHVWNMQQRVAYMEFFLRGGKTARVIYFNSPTFCNANLTEERKAGRCDLPDTIVCVDGLQRLTTLLMFLDNKVSVFGHYLSEFEDAKDLGKIKYDIEFCINGLLTRKELLTWYLEMNSGGVVHSSEELQRVYMLLKQCK